MTEVIEGTEETVTISKAEHRRLLEIAEDHADILAGREVAAALARGEDELIPAEFVNRMTNGESPVRVFRELRGLSGTALADKAGVNRVQLHDIENGRKRGSVDTLRKIADALGVTVDDLI